QVVEILGREAQPLQPGERVVEAAGDRVAAPRRQVAEVELEGGPAGAARGQVGLGHGELVEVGEERVAQGWASAPRISLLSTSRAPRSSISAKARSLSPGWRSIPRQASRITQVSSPSLRASRTE